MSGGCDEADGAGPGTSRIGSFVVVTHHVGMDMSRPTQFSRIAKTRFAVRWRDMLSSLGLLLAYGLSFVALHHAAEFWGFGAPYSFWFPAAGLRFALLWQMGARMAPAAAIAEMVAELATGELVLGRIPCSD
ncbi:hypothetical protein [Sphingomonas oryzagri]